MELEGVKLWNLWIVAGVVAGFQIGAFRWRIERELRMEEKNQTVWFPVTDWMLVGSFVGLLITVFILPTPREYLGRVHSSIACCLCDSPRRIPIRIDRAL